MATSQPVTLPCKFFGHAQPQHSFSEVQHAQTHSPQPANHVRSAHTSSKTLKTQQIRRFQRTVAHSQPLPKHLICCHSSPIQHQHASTNTPSHNCVAPPHSHNQKPAPHHCRQQNFTFCSNHQSSPYTFQFQYEQNKISHRPATPVTA